MERGLDAEMLAPPACRHRHHYWHFQPKSFGLRRHNSGSGCSNPGSRFVGRISKLVVEWLSTVFTLTELLPIRSHLVMLGLSDASTAASCEDQCSTKTISLPPWSTSGELHDPRLPAGYLGSPDLGRTALQRKRHCAAATLALAPPFVSFYLPTSQSGGTRIHVQGTCRKQSSNART